MNISETIATGNVANTPIFSAPNRMTKFDLVIEEQSNGETFTTFFTVKHFGKQFDSLSKILKKGARVFVHGPIRAERDIESGRDVYCIYTRKVMLLDKKSKEAA